MYINFSHRSESNYIYHEYQISIQGAGCRSSAVRDVPGVPRPRIRSRRTRPRRAVRPAVGSPCRRRSLRVVLRARARSPDKGRRGRKCRKEDTAPDPARSAPEDILRHTPPAFGICRTSVGTCACRQFLRTDVETPEAPGLLVQLNYIAHATIFYFHELSLSPN